MSLSVIGPIQSAPAAIATQAPTAAPVSAPAPAASLPQDTVNISAAGHAAASSGDVDRDGDSH
jgi:hypothetical protein